MPHHYASRWEALVERYAASSCASRSLLNRRANA
jgi:hypothetical protein